MIKTTTKPFYLPKKKIDKCVIQIALRKFLSTQILNFKCSLFNPFTISPWNRMFVKFR